MDFFSEIRYVLRGLIKNRGFAFVVILSVALGIGTTTAIFSIVDAVLLRPLPYSNPDRLVALYESIPEKGVPQMHVSGPNFQDWRDASRTVQKMSAYSESFFNVSGHDYPERVPGIHVSEDFFALLGVQPLYGRFFSQSEFKKGTDRVAILSHAVWQRRFSGDPSILNKQVRIDDSSTRIVGIMPAGFRFPAEAEVWMPHSEPPHQFNRSLNMFSVVAQVKEDQSLAKAQAELTSIARSLEQEYPESNRGHHILLLSLHDAITGTSVTPLLVLLSAVGLLLIICCANVGNLMLIHVASREKQLAVRVALGERRAQTIRQLLMEGFFLATAGCAGGVLLAFLAVRMLPALSPDVIPRMQEITINLRIVLFSIVTSFVTAMFFSLFPVRHIFKMDLQRIIQRRASGDTGQSKTSRSLLVVMEIALACALTTGSILFIQSFTRLMNMDGGFNTSGVMTFRLELPDAKYPEDHQKVDFYKRLLHQIRMLPSVQSAGATNILPMTGVFMLALFVESSPSDPADVPISAYRVATPGYFPASGIRMLQGRGFEDRDTPQSTPVAVVDQATAKKWWPGQSAIGKRISFQGPKGPWLTVIGVVGNVRHHGLNKNVFPTAYVPHSQTPFAGMMIAVRTATDPNLLTADIRRIVTSFNQDLPIYKMIPFDQVVSESVVSKRFPVILVTSFSVFALFLAVLGVYGMVSYNTSRRTREIGIRMAVGARKADILRMVLGEGLGLTVAGLLFGFLVAIAFGRLISSMLFSTSPFEPLAFAGVSLIVIVVGLFASFFPAHRAIKIDPNRVMRYE